MKNVESIKQRKQRISLGMKRIERLRSELKELVGLYGLQNSKVIRKSQQLDKLIVLYMKRIPRRQPLDYPITAVDGQKMINTLSKAPPSMWKDSIYLFKKVERLYKEVEVLNANQYPPDPKVDVKSRELDRLIMKCIRS